MNRKWLYRTDITLRCLFLLTLLSGLSMHAVGHGMWLQGNRLWTAVHLLCTWSFLVFCWKKIKAHWGWYRNLGKGFGRHSKVTCFLSVMYLLTVVSGIMLLTLKGTGNTHWGICHFQTGLFFEVLGVWHLCSWLRQLRKLR